MTKSTRKIVQYWLVAVFLSSCASDTTMVHYYTLASYPKELTESLNKDKPLILMDTISLVDYLRQPGLVIQKEEHQLQISNVHRWAESLEKSTSRVIRHQFEKKLPQYRFEGQNNRWKAKPKYRISIELTHFQVANHKNTTVTSGQFWIFDKNDELVVKKQFFIEEKLIASGYDFAISKLESSLVKLSGLIYSHLI